MGGAASNQDPETAELDTGMSSDVAEKNIESEAEDTENGANGMDTDTDASEAEARTHTQRIPLSLGMQENLKILKAMLVSPRAMILSVSPK